MTPERWKQVDDLFLAVSEMEPAARREHLDQACSGDPDLRREVELLLAHDSAPTEQDFGSAVESGLKAWAKKSGDLIGRHAGPYRILESIGRGGMGAVFLAVRDDDQYQRRVAVKLVRSDMGTGQILDRFRQERQILANLQHPNIAQMLDGGVTGDGLPYFAMEYVEGGKPITHYCSERNLPLRARLELFRQVCAAVAYAHENLVVHRDLKPGNILVRPDGVVKLLDFGVAKLLAETPGSGAEPLTRAGLLMLTPEYASPEQVRGEAVSTASDVYMLGAVLYEVLTGQPAHRLGDYSPVAIAEAVCSTDTVRPSAAVPRTEPALRKSLEGDLDNIILMALSKERERRYRTAEALSDDLRRYLAGEPVSAREDTLLYRGGKFVRRNRAAVAAAVLVVASLAGGLGVAVVQARRAERRFAEVRKLANTFLFAFHDKIQNLQGSTEARQFVVSTAQEYLDRLAAEAGGDLGLREELAMAYARVAQVQANPRDSNLGQPEQALVNLRKAQALAGSVLAAAPGRRDALRVLVQSHMQRGDMLVNGGKNADGAAELRLAADAAERLVRLPNAEAEDLRWHNRVWLSWGDSLLEDNPSEAARLFERAAGTLRSIPAQAGSELAESLQVLTLERLGEAQHALGRPEAAIATYEQARQVQQKLAREHPQNAKYRRELSRIYNFLGNFSGHPGYFHAFETEKAIGYYRQASAITEELTRDDPKDMRGQMDRALDAAKLAEVLVDSAPREAVAQGRLCLARADALPLKTHQIERVRQNCMEPLAFALLASGERQEALTLFRKLLAIGEKMYARNPSNLGARSTYIAALWDLGKVRRDKALLEQALAEARKASRELPKDLYFLRDVARIEEDLGTLTGDRKHFAEALAAWQQWAKAGSDSIYVRRSVEQLRQRMAQAGALP